MSLLLTPHDVENEGFQSLDTFGIARKFCIGAVGRAVNFDDQFGLKSYEVDDISVDRILATKFIAPIDDFSAPTIAGLRHCSRSGFEGPKTIAHDRTPSPGSLWTMLS